jgi:hypothetical protein
MLSQRQSPRLDLLSLDAARFPVEFAAITRPTSR